MYHAIMAQKPTQGPHGHPVGFRRDCAECAAVSQARRATPEAKRQRADARQRQQATRAGRLLGLAANEPDGGTIVALPTRAAAAPTIGENEQAVIAQCEMSKQAEVKPGIVTQARTLARILDAPELMTIWPRTSSQLQALLKELDGPRKKSSGRLIQVSAMAGRKAAASQ